MSSIFSMTLWPRDAICLHVEFTNPASPVLLSLGLASGGGPEHYAELELDDAGRLGILSGCSDPVSQRAVMAQLGRMPGCAGTSAVMAQKTSDWLLAEAQQIHDRSGQPAFIALTHLSKFTLLKQLLQEHGHWAALEPLVQPLDVSDLTSRLGPSLVRSESFLALRSRGIGPHHSMAEALALRVGLHGGLTGKRRAP